MALKGYRKIVDERIDWFMNETAEKGVTVCYPTSLGGSGAALDHGEATVRIATTTSGAKVAGLLLSDVVNIDLTRQHLNQHKDEVNIGGKVAVATKGWLLTNKLHPSVSVTAPGLPAYLAVSGLLHTSQADAGTPQVGIFETKPDTDGYAKVSFNLPS